MFHVNMTIPRNIGGFLEMKSKVIIKIPQERGSAAVINKVTGEGEVLTADDPNGAKI